jgi:hypothetical protein
MVIKLNCFDRADPADLVPVMAALAEAAQRIDVPHARLGAVLDWVQYRRNFRDVVEVRRFVGTENPCAEIAIDVRRARELDAPVLAAAIVDRVAELPRGERVVLERWTAPSESLVWAFNATYWRHLCAWDSTFDKHYAAALPGGVSDGTNPEFWRDRIAAFVDTLEGLERTGRLPEEIHVLEAGVGSGAQARLWLDTFASTPDARLAEICASHDIAPRHAIRRSTPSCAPGRRRWATRRAGCASGPMSGMRCAWRRSTRRPTSSRATCSSRSRTGPGYTSRRWPSRALPRPSTSCIPTVC